MPEFIMLIADEEQERSAKYYQAVGSWWQEHERAGRLKADRGARLQRAQTARTVRVNGANRTVTDGPFAESREVIGGFGIIDAPTLEEAVELAKSWPGDHVSLEVRPLFQM